MNLKTIMSKAVLENMSSGAAQAIKELDDNMQMSPKELESYLTQRFTSEEIMATCLFDDVNPNSKMNIEEAKPASFYKQELDRLSN